MNVPEKCEDLSALPSEKPIGASTDRAAERCFWTFFLLFLFILEIVCLPVAIVALFLCVLEILVKKCHGIEKEIRGKKGLYRSFIRPIGRYLAWAPIALILTALLCAVALFYQYILAAVIVGAPIVFALFFLKDLLIYTKQKVLKSGTNDQE
jgi:hypothetical protein